jgi:class 3 adenylate cyclase/tetratricopeptide (TPR) repeat protein
VDCTSCGTRNEAGRKFCGECGTRLAAACPACGSPNGPEAKFCGECGTALGGPSTPRPALSGPGPGGPGTAAQGRIAERRLVSVLFADLVGFTPFAEERDPEETRELLSRYFELARAVIERYGGTVEKFIGDAVMAVWGAPVAREDDAERAVRAGLELVDAVRGIGPTIQARCGVLTGEAAVTLGAIGEGMVAGDLVNTASRLQSAAPPGSVLVGETTQRAAAAAIVFEAAGEQALKGKAAPAPAWIARRVVAERGGRNRADTLEAPFVGRDVELRLLKDLFHATATERRPRLVSVTGQGGIGKSRLAWEFLKYIDGLVDDVYWHQGRSPAYGDGLAMWALGEMVRERAGLTEADDEPTTRARLRETLETFVPDAAERSWLEPALLTLLGHGEAAPATEQLFAAWRTFFERVAAHGPTVLVFEDLQWADATQLDFIDHLLEWTREAPLFLITLARPELLDRRTEWTAGRRGFAALALEPLREAAMRELLDGLAPGLPEATVGRIVARADGIPLYAVETVRMLVAEGRLVEQDGAYRPTGDLESIAIPETLHALIAARLDALDPADRAVVQDAAVLGGSFSAAGLASLSGLDEAELAGRLRRLVQREILDLQADPRSPERGQYAFVQALIREVAYGSLAKADRKTRHLAAARYFESLGADELAGVLATHYTAAYELVAEGPERDALATQSRLALRAAAERAVVLGAHEPALGYLRQAAALTTDSVERAELLSRAGRSATAAFHRDEATELLAEAVALLRTGSDRSAIASAVAAQGRVTVELLRSQQAIDLLLVAVDEFADLGDDPALADLRSQLSRAYFMHGEPEAAIREAEAVLPTLERLSLIPLLADVLVTKGSAMGPVGRLREGLAILRGGLDLARTHGIVSTEMRGLVNLSALAGVEDPRLGFEVAREGVALAERLGWHGHMASMLANAVVTGESCGEWDWLAETTARIAADEPDPQLRAFLATSLVGIEAMRHESPEAGVAELERLFADETDPNTRANVESARATVDMAEGRYETAYESLRRLAPIDPFTAPSLLGSAIEAALWLRDEERAADTLAAFRTYGIRGRWIDATIGGYEAGIEALRGDRAGALTRYRWVFAELGALDAPFDEARLIVLAAWLLGPDEPALREPLERARATLERLRATVLLERLDAAPGSTPGRGADVRANAVGPASAPGQSLESVG